MFEGKCGIISTFFFRKTGNRSNKGRCITRITVFICGVLCVHFPLAYQSPRKKSHRGTAFFAHGSGAEGRGVREGELCQLVLIGLLIRNVLHVIGGVVRVRYSFRLIGRIMWWRMLVHRLVRHVAKIKLLDQSVLDGRSGSAFDIVDYENLVDIGGVKCKVKMKCEEQV